MISFHLLFLIWIITYHIVKAQLGVPDCVDYKKDGINIINCAEIVTKDVCYHRQYKDEERKATLCNMTIEIVCCKDKEDNGYFWQLSTCRGLVVPVNIVETNNDTYRCNRLNKLRTTTRKTTTPTTTTQSPKPSTSTFTNASTTNNITTTPATTENNPKVLSTTIIIVIIIVVVVIVVITVSLLVFVYRKKRKAKAVVQGDVSNTQTADSNSLPTNSTAQYNNVSSTVAFSATTADNRVSDTEYMYIDSVTDETQENEYNHIQHGAHTKQYTDNEYSHINRLVSAMPKGASDLYYNTTNGGKISHKKGGTNSRSPGDYDYANTCNLSSNNVSRGANKNHPIDDDYDHANVMASRQNKEQYSDYSKANFH